MANIYAIGAPFPQFFDDSGNPLEGGKLYAYVAGTSTPLNTYPTYTDALNSTNANPIPVVMNERGEPYNSANIGIWLNAAAKITLKSSAGVLIKEMDNVNSTSPLAIEVDGTTVIGLTNAASAVNYLNVTNSATGNPILDAAAGFDTNIGRKVDAKGSGTLSLNTVGTGATVIGNTTGNTSVTGTLTVSSTITTASLLAPSATLNIGATGVTTTMPGILVVTKSITATGNPKARVTFSGNQAIAGSGTNTKIQFNSETIDTNNNFDSVTNYRFLPTIAGYYHVNAMVQYGVTSAATDTYTISIYKNGADVKTMTNNWTFVASGQIAIAVTDVIQCNGTTDYIEIFTSQNSGTSRNIAQPSSASFYMIP